MNYDPEVILIVAQTLQRIGRAGTLRVRLRRAYLRAQRWKRRNNKVVYMCTYSKRQLLGLQRYGRGYLGRKRLSAALRPLVSSIHIIDHALDWTTPSLMAASKRSHVHRAGAARAIQHWWKHVWRNKCMRQNNMTVARLAAVNAVAILIQRWWRAVLKARETGARVRRVYQRSSPGDVSNTAMSIVRIEELQQRRTRQQHGLVVKWKSLVHGQSALRTLEAKSDSQKRTAITHHVVRSRVRKPHKFLVAPRHLTNYEAALRDLRPEWRCSAKVFHDQRSWYSVPRDVQ